MSINKKLSIHRALTWIGLSVAIVNGFAYLTIQGYFYWKEEKKQPLFSAVTTIIQTGPQKEALKTDYLAQLVGLSKNRPHLMKESDLKNARERLLTSPVIKEAELKVLNSGVLYIDYTVRQPIALLYDFENMAIDEDKTLFPLNPFFSPKNLPEIYLGLGSTGHKSLEGAKVELAFAVLKLINEPSVKDFVNLRRIDVSKAFERSYGRQEIVLIVEDEMISKIGEQEVHYYLPQYLRLSRKKYAQELGNYLQLREELLKKEEEKLKLPVAGETSIVLNPKIIDLRLAQLAFIDEKKATCMPSER